MKRLRRNYESAHFTYIKPRFPIYAIFYLEADSLKLQAEVMGIEATASHFEAEFYDLKQNFLRLHFLLVNSDKLSLSNFNKIRYNKRARGRQVSTSYLENAHLWDRLNKLRLVPQVCKHQRKEDEVMIFLEILGRIVSILVGIATLAEKCKAYIQHQKGRTEKDPSVSLPASDGSKDDCISNR